MEKETLGAFVCELRKEKQMTQKEMAEKLGITDKAISKWERAESLPDILVLKQIADIPFWKPYFTPDFCGFEQILS